MENYTGIILAGGKSQRMGTDKGLLLLNGKPFITHIYEAMQAVIGDNILVISSNKDYDAFGYNRVEDFIANKGPVGGLYTALKFSKTKYNLVLSVDVPLVSPALLEWLVRSHDESFLLTRLQLNEKTMPLVAVYDRALRTLVGEHLAGNQLKLTEIIEEIAPQTIAVPEIWAAQLQNINTQEDYKNIQK